MIEESSLQGKSNEDNREIQGRKIQTENETQMNEESKTLQKQEGKEDLFLSNTVEKDENKSTTPEVEG